MKMPSKPARLLTLIVFLVPLTWTEKLNSTRQIVRERCVVVGFETCGKGGVRAMLRVFDL